MSTNLNLLVRMSNIKNNSLSNSFCVNTEVSANRVGVLLSVTEQLKVSQVDQES